MAWRCGRKRNKIVTWSEKRKEKNRYKKITDESGPKQVATRHAAEVCPGKLGKRAEQIHGSRKPKIEGKKQNKLWFTKKSKGTNMKTDPGMQICWNNAHKRWLEPWKSTFTMRETWSNKLKIVSNTSKYKRKYKTPVWFNNCETTEFCRLRSGDWT